MYWNELNANHVITINSNSLESNRCDPKKLACEQKGTSTMWINNNEVITMLTVPSVGFLWRKIAQIFYGWNSSGRLAYCIEQQPLHKNKQYN